MLFVHLGGASLGRQTRAVAQFTQELLRATRARVYRDISANVISGHFQSVARIEILGLVDLAGTGNELRLRLVPSKFAEFRRVTLEARGIGKSGGTVFIGNAKKK